MQLSESCAGSPSTVVGRYVNPDPSPPASRTARRPSRSSHSAAVIPSGIGIDPASIMATSAGPRRRSAYAASSDPDVQAVVAMFACQLAGWVSEYP